MHNYCIHWHYHNLAIIHHECSVVMHPDPVTVLYFTTAGLALLSEDLTLVPGEHLSGSFTAREPWQNHVTMSTNQSRRDDTDLIASLESLSGKSPKANNRYTSNTKIRKWEVIHAVGNMQAGQVSLPLAARNVLYIWASSCSLSSCVVQTNVVDFS